MAILANGSFSCLQTLVAATTGPRTTKPSVASRSWWEKGLSARFYHVAIGVDERDGYRTEGCYVGSGAADKPQNDWTSKFYIDV